MTTSSDGPGSWDDLRLLRVVAATGSLSRAARELGLTQPTVGRRLDKLEASVGMPLVRRTRQGCRLTERGAALLPLLDRMQEAADGVERLAKGAHNDLAGVVRIATGDLVAWYLSRRWAELVHGAPQLRLELASGIGFASLERGEADLAIRSLPPKGDHWVVQRLGRARFGIYASPGLLRSRASAAATPLAPDLPWVGLDPSSAMRSARWLREHLGREPELTFTSSLLVLEAAANGAGLAVLPTYVGDDEPRLQRVGEPIDELGIDSHLVIHPSARRLPRVRWVAGRVREILLAKDAA